MLTNFSASVASPIASNILYATESEEPNSPSSAFSSCLERCTTHICRRTYLLQYQISKVGFFSFVYISLTLHYLFSTHRSSPWKMRPQRNGINRVFEKYAYGMCCIRYLCYKKRREDNAFRCDS